MKTVLVLFSIINVCLCANPKPRILQSLGNLLPSSITQPCYHAPVKTGEDVKNVNGAWYIVGESTNALTSWFPGHNCHTMDFSFGDDKKIKIDISTLNKGVSKVQESYMGELFAEDTGDIIGAKTNWKILDTDGDGAKNWAVVSKCTSNGFPDLGTIYVLLRELPVDNTHINEAKKALVDKNIPVDNIESFDMKNC